MVFVRAADLGLTRTNLKFYAPLVLFLMFHEQLNNMLGQVVVKVVIMVVPPIFLPFVIISYFYYGFYMIFGHVFGIILYFPFLMFFSAMDKESELNVVVWLWLWFIFIALQVIYHIQRDIRVAQQRTQNSKSDYNTSRVPWHSQCRDIV